MVWKQVAATPVHRKRWQCFEPDGVTVHWDTCSKRRWQQVKATGERFENERRIEHPAALVSGYTGSVHGEKFDRIVGLRIVGARYRPPSGQCRDCVPPWEPCLGCPDAFEVTL